MSDKSLWALFSRVDPALLCSGSGKGPFPGEQTGTLGSVFAGRFPELIINQVMDTRFNFFPWQRSSQWVCDWHCHQHQVAPLHSC